MRWSLYVLGHIFCDLLCLTSCYRVLLCYKLCFESCYINKVYYYHYYCIVNLSNEPTASWKEFGFSHSCKKTPTSYQLNIQDRRVLSVHSKKQTKPQIHNKMSLFCVFMSQNNQIQTSINLESTYLNHHTLHSDPDFPLCSIFIPSFPFSPRSHGSILIVWFLCCRLVGGCFCLWLVLTHDRRRFGVPLLHLFCLGA